MLVDCKDCGTEFDDAARLTFCPHELIMPADDLEQKKLGLSLIGKPIRFAHEPDGPNRSVQAIGWNGMVTLQGMAGEFAPHLFIFAPVLQDECALSPEEAIDALVVGDVVTAEAGGSLVTDGGQHALDEPDIRLLPPEPVMAICISWPKCECGERDPLTPKCSVPNPIGGLSKVTFEDAAAAMAKGVPLAATICTYVVLDTESNGLFDYDKPAEADGQPRVAQASMIFLDPSLAEIGRFSKYVKPEGWAMTPGATKVNGLTTEFLLANGGPIGEVLDIFEAVVKAGAVVCAHNCQHDLKHMRAELRRAGRDDLFEQTYQFCTMREWAAHHKAKWPKLAELCAMLGIPQQGAHTAEGDAEAVAKILPLMRDLGIEIEGKVHRSSKPQFASRGKSA